MSGYPGIFACAADMGGPLAGTKVDDVWICVDTPNAKGPGYSPELVQRQIPMTIETALRLQGMLATAIQTALDRRTMGLGRTA